MFDDGLQDALPNPPDSIAHKRVSFAGIESFGGFCQPSISCLNKLLMSETSVQILLCHKFNITLVFGNQFTRVDLILYHIFVKRGVLIKEAPLYIFIR